MMLAAKDHASRVGGPAGCRLNQVLQAALTSIDDTKQQRGASVVSSPPNGAGSAQPPGAGGGSGKIKCDECGRLFSTKGNMMRHVQATHTRLGVKTFPCGVCGRQFKRREDLITHGRVHTGEKPYACSHKNCGKRFARISDQRSHERIHRSDAKRYECKHCGKRFTRPYDLKKHEMNIHRQEPPSIGKKRREGGGGVVANACFSGTGAGGGTRHGGLKRPRITGVGVEVSGKIPRKHEHAVSSQPLPIAATVAADGLVASVQQQQLQQQAGAVPSSQPLPMATTAAADGLVASVQQQQLQQQAGAVSSSQPLPMAATAAADGLVASVQQQQLQQQAGAVPSSQPLPMAVTAAADGLVASVQQQQLQQQAGAAHSSQPLPMAATAAADGLVASVQQQQLQQQAGAVSSSQPRPIAATVAANGLVATDQRQQLQEQHNQQWRQQYQAWQSKQQLLNQQQQQQQQPEKPGSLTDSSLPPVGQGHRHLPLPLLSQPPPPPPPPGPAIATAAAAPPPAKAPAAPHRHVRRKRVRCDTHKHCTPAAELARVNSEGRANMVNVPRGSDTSGSVPPERKIADAFSEAKAHVHGAACGHVAVLHENHVDFLTEGGQLECFDGKEKTPESWVSSSKEGGGGGGGCGCPHDARKAKTDAAASNSNGNGTDSNNNNNNTDGNGSNGDEKRNGNPWKIMTRDDLIHWDGARADQPRGNCSGDNHGPHCGHDVIHHDGHLDYVVNGRLLHPVQVDATAADGNGDGTGAGTGNDGATATQFEDHGSIRALDEDFVTFWSSFSLLSEMADDEVLSFCDLCSTDEAGSGVDLSPVA